MGRNMPRDDPMREYEFGVMVSCWSGDVPLLNGCLASIRLYHPEVPICLVTHGNVHTEVYERVYGVQVLRESQVDPRLKNISYGYGLTKMVSFWHSPFSTFIHIDADAVSWGPFINKELIKSKDFVYNEQHEELSEFIRTTQYFDANLFTPSFDWRYMPYFNTGCFYARRGVFDLERYIALRELQMRLEGAIFTDQGIINIMLFEALDAGMIRAEASRLQAIVPSVSREELNRRFRFENGRPVIAPGEALLLHWAGPKPYLIDSGPFSEAMTYFRVMHRRNAGLINAGRVPLYYDEFYARHVAKHGNSFIRAAKAKISYKLGSLFRRI